MGKYLVSEVKCGVSEGGVACGPGSGSVVVSVNVTEGDKSFWLSNAEVTGIPNFYLTDQDIYEKLVNDDDEDFYEKLEEKFIKEFDGIALGEYDDIFASIRKNVGNPAVSLIRYIILLTRCSMDEVEDIVAMAKGKYVDDIEVPASDVEK